MRVYFQVLCSIPFVCVFVLIIGQGLFLCFCNPVGTCYTLFILFMIALAFWVFVFLINFIIIFCLSKEYNGNFNGHYIKFVAGFNQYGHFHNRISTDAWTCGVFLSSNVFCRFSVFTVEVFAYFCGFVFGLLLRL